MNKHKVVIHQSDFTNLFDVVSASAIELSEKIEYDVKEISVYRLESMWYLHDRLHGKISKLRIGKPIVMRLPLHHILTLRYCLMRRRTTAGLNQLFMDIDKTIHPDMFKRSETIN